MYVQQPMEGKHAQGPGVQFARVEGTDVQLCQYEWQGDNDTGQLVIRPVSTIHKCNAPNLTKNGLDLYCSTRHHGHTLLARDFADENEVKVLEYRNQYEAKHGITVDQAIMQASVRHELKQLGATLKEEKVKSNGMWLLKLRLADGSKRTIEIAIDEEPEDAETFVRELLG